MKNTVKNTVLARFDAYDRRKLAKAGLNLSAAFVVSPNRAQSLAKIYDEWSRGGAFNVFAFALSSVYCRTVVAKLRPGGFDICCGYCTKADFRQYKNDSDMDFVLFVSFPLEYVGKNFFPDRKPNEAGKYGRDKSGYELPRIDERKRAAHAYCARVRMERAKAAFNPAYRNAALIKANEILESFRARIANAVLTVPNFYDIMKKISYPCGWFGWDIRDIKRAETAAQHAPQLPYPRRIFGNSFRGIPPAYFWESKKGRGLLGNSSGFVFQSKVLIS